MSDRERAELWIRRAAESTDVRHSAQPFGVDSLAAEFAAVRADERERCAKLCDERERINRDEWKLGGESHWGSLADESAGIAAAIRAGGERAKSE